MQTPAPEITLRVGDVRDGFRVTDTAPLPNLRAHAYRLEHVATGAKLLHVHSRDSENLFSITFPTPPADDTGIAHILEHAVLGGSKKFPVKEPFFEMIKMSMATFINAMTFDAHTAYPVASSVKRDFFNLAEVYTDAVFHPELAEATFRREGHHLALEDNSDPKSALKVKGIVYNEMKGAYSNPEMLAWRHAGNALFPDTPLGRDSGGDPESIPDLTFDAFKRFHADLYHPSNALIFIYGDIPTQEHLAFLNERLAGFTRREVRADVARQPRWTEPRRLDKSYPIGKDEKTEQKTYLTLGWVVGDALDAADDTAWGVLDRLLLGNEAAPLKKALIDSKLGADLFYSGAGSTAHENVFRVGLKGSEPERSDEFLQLVLNTLRRIAGDGFERGAVDAAFQQLAYHHLEIQTLFPLRLMYAVNAAWPHGIDPLTFLRMDEHLAACRRRYEADPAVFTRLIRERLLDNPHRLLAVFTPDRELQDRTEAAFAERMKRERSRFSEAELARIGREAAALDASQSVPNSPEQLAKLPQLKVGDLPAKPRHIPTSVERIAGGVELLRNDVFANGVNYLQLDFNLEGLPAELYAYLPRYGEAVSKLGAAGQPYTKIAERRAAYTGGVGAWESFFTHATDPSRSLHRVRFSLKTLDGQVPEALALLRDLLFAVDPRDRQRLGDVVRQSRAAYRQSLVQNGSGTASRHAARGLSPEGAMNETVSGLPALALIEALADRYDELAPDLMVKIEAIRDFLLVRGRLTASFTGSDESYRVVRGTLEDWAGKMRDEPVRPAPLPFTPFARPPREGLAAPMQVSFCTMVMTAPHGDHPDAPVLDMAARFVSLDYVLNEVRLKGNAYGGGVGYNGAERTFGFHSYRDPRLVETVGVFRGLKDHVRRAAWTQTEIDRAIIGSAKDAERPIRPGEATDSALTRHIRGDTPRRREERYSRMLRATPEDTKRVLLEQLEGNEAKAAVCVVSSREKLEAANRELGGEGLEIQDLIR